MAFSERTHQTRVGSRCQRLLSDMVQGSGIRPVLFLCYINELAEILERRVLQLNYLPMTSNYMWRLLMTDAFKLQNALDLLTKWANMWQLSVSVDTCCVLGIGRLPVTAPIDFYIDGHKLSLVSFCRDLGVTVSHDLKPTTHIRQIVTKAHQRNSTQFCFRRHWATLACFHCVCLTLTRVPFNSVVTPR